MYITGEKGTNEPHGEKGTTEPHGEKGGMNAWPEGYSAIGHLYIFFCTIIFPYFAEPYETHKNMAPQGFCGLGNFLKYCPL